MKNKRESGEVAVEASIIVTLVFIVISVMFYIGMALYQRTAIAVVANRTATNISQVYSNTLRDPFTGYVNYDNAYQPVTYKSIKTDAYLDVVRQKGTAFAQYRLKKSQIISAVDRDVEVQVVNKPNEILKGQVVVTITDTYDIPLVGFFGLDGKLTFSASGRADCVDYLEYLLGVETIADPEHSPIQSIEESDTCIVTFVKDKISGGFHSAVPVLRGKSIITSNRYSHSTMPDNPTLNGMVFGGWVTDDGTPFTASTQVDENITVYGTWECKVNFDPCGGTVAPTQIVAPYRKTVAFPTPERYSYKFLGWYTEKNGAGTKYESNVTEITGNITLYAHWECVHANFINGRVVTPAVNCVSRAVCQEECQYCGYVRTYSGAAGPHSFTGRCGESHELGELSYYMKTHRGNIETSNTVLTVAAECVVCIHCGDFWDGVFKANEDDEQPGSRTLSDGTEISIGMYCREHEIGGKRSVDDGYSDTYGKRQKVPVH